MCGVQCGVLFACQVFPNVTDLFRITSNLPTSSSVLVRGYLCGAVSMEQTQKEKYVICFCHLQVIYEFHCLEEERQN